MPMVNIREAKTQFSRIVEQAAAGEEIIIARAGKPVARLMPLVTPLPPTRQLGLGKGKFTLPAEFNALNAEEMQNMFEQGK